MRNFADRRYRGNQGTFYVQLILFYESRAGCDMMWKNVQPDRPQMAIQYGAEKMRIACRIAKSRTRTHTLIIIIFTAS